MSAVRHTEVSEATPHLVGRSTTVHALRESIRALAPLDVPVLIAGEAGVGKTLAATLLHEQRGRGALVRFGERQDARLPRSAGPGTLLVEEIGELQPTLQDELLALLDRAHPWRLVATTRHDLSDATSMGRFRIRLYHQVAVATLKISPLRERSEDIPLLAEHLGRELARRGLIPSTLEAWVLRGLQTRAWPDNVRELRDFLERRWLGISQGPPPNFSLSLREALEEFERERVSSALELSKGNISHAAALLKTNRRFVQRAIRRFGLRGATG